MKPWAWVLALASGGLSGAALTLTEHRMSLRETGVSDLSAQVIVWNLLPFMALVFAGSRARRPAQFVGACVFSAAVAIFAAFDTAFFPSVFGSGVLYLVSLYEVFVIVPVGFALGSLVGLARDELKKQRPKSAA